MLTGMKRFKHGSSLVTVALLVLAGVAGRLLPHAPNATPLTALALVSGAALGGFHSVFIPLATLLITDLLIGTYSMPVMASVYACFLLPVTLGRFFLKNDRRPWLIGGIASISSVVFFLVTNFAIWFFDDWYSHDLTGLMGCYAAALPFARNMISADLLWSAALFSGLAIIEGRKITVLTPAVVKS
ncbi:MAG: DUF6580 family putative transport protein [Isosphaeraceae bacterium]